jgi:hypothetical protein
MASQQEGALRLNLGCGNDILQGYVNHDVFRHRPEVDVTHDLRQLPWPWGDECAEIIRLLDVLEHLPEVVPILDESWRILKPGGVLHVRVPHYQSENTWLDPTHRRGFHLDSFDYFDPETAWGTKYGFYTPRKWKVGAKQLEGGNVVVFMHTRKGNDLAATAWTPFTEEERQYQATVEVAAFIPQWSSFILVGGECWVNGETFAGRRRIPFLERDGEHWGNPADDETAIRELERLRQAGAGFIAFVWHAFWWLEYYAGFQQHLHSTYPCILQNDRLVIFDLRH